jgi:hypothetical protein
MKEEDLKKKDKLLRKTDLLKYLNVLPNLFIFQFIKSFSLKISFKNTCFQFSLKDNNLINYKTQVNNDCGKNNKKKK